ncbi:uncharacterized protein [Nicotiana sylvestris]|uniref:uncharacterized protein n=1 Tax=Nicotiana sylvestris TaxID=4096 RepID=UPI00388C8FC4
MYNTLDQTRLIPLAAATSQAGGGAQTPVAPIPEKQVQVDKIPEVIPILPVAPTQPEGRAAISEEEQQRLERWTEECEENFQKLKTTLTTAPVLVKKLYDQAFYKLQYELSCREEELKKLTSKLSELKASSAQKEEELNWAKDALVGQFQEEVAAKDMEILELKRQNEAVALEKDLLWGELASTQDLLRSAQKEVTVLSVDKTKADEDASSYKRDAATANDQDGEISKKAEQKLARAVTYARLQARRQDFEEASTKGVDLSDEIKKAKTLEEESTPSTTSDEVSGSDSDGSEGEE